MLYNLLLNISKIIRDFLVNKQQSDIVMTYFLK